MAGIEAVPVPGIIVVIAVPGAVNAVEGVIEMRSIVPGIVVPGIPVPGRVAVTPGPIIPGIVETPVAIVEIPHIPRPVCPRIIVEPGGSIPDGNDGFAVIETDFLSFGYYEGVPGAEDIGLGRMAVCEQIVQFLTGGSLRHHLLDGTGIEAIVEHQGADTACGRAGNGGKEPQGICQKCLFHSSYLLLSNKIKYLCADKKSALLRDNAIFVPLSLRSARNFKHNNKKSK
jgi:hypothetical protein